jgi:hypothetical protein
MLVNELMYFDSQNMNNHWSRIKYTDVLRASCTRTVLDFSLKNCFAIHLVEFLIRIHISRERFLL